MNARRLVKSDFKPSDLVSKININLKNEKNVEEWINFWIKEMAVAAGVLKETEDKISLQELNNRISKNDVENNKIIYIFDGLEDIFQEIPVEKQKNQKIALKALLDIPNRIAEIRDVAIGLIIFIRRDFLNYTITQNLKQFEARYREFDLTWDDDSFLKLVYWLCQKSEVDLKSNITAGNLPGRQDIIDALKNLWGLKLGQDKSKEAYSTNWVYAALSDYNEQLQARDVIRLLYFSANIALNKNLYKSWEDRIIPPSAIREAINQCSKEKVKETEEENRIFKEWVKQIETLSKNDKKIPSSQSILKLQPDQLELLKKIGVIYEDTNVEGNENLYIPEIYRRGLGFKLERGARPGVLVHKKKIF